MRSQLSIFLVLGLAFSACSGGPNSPDGSTGAVQNPNPRPEPTSTLTPKPNPSPSPTPTQTPTPSPSPSPSPSLQPVPLKVTGVSPSVLPKEGGALTISGQGFDTTSGVRVDIGPNEVQTVVCPIAQFTSTSITCNVPAGTPGQTNLVIVRNLPGVYAPKPYPTFTYFQPLTVSSVYPANLPTSGGTLSIEGTGFSSSNTQVEIGLNENQLVSCPTTQITGTSIRCTAPLGNSGSYIVVVKNSGVAAPKPFPTVEYKYAHIIGQTSSTVNTATLSASGLKEPEGIFSDGTRLVVADTGHNRVLIWNTIPSTLGRPADIVLGQPNFTSGTSNQGFSSASASTLSGPTHLAMDANGKLIVSDTGNNRVLIWNSFPTQNNQPANVVIGQPNMTGNGCNSPALGAASLCGPKGVAVKFSSLYVADQNNHRVLVFSSIPTSNGTSASYVVGQSDFTSNTGGRSSTKLMSPAGLSVQNRLIVADQGNNRVLTFLAPVTKNLARAENVFGQSNSFTADSSGCGPAFTNGPAAVFENSLGVMVSLGAGHKIYRYSYTYDSYYYDNAQPYSLGNAATSCSPNAGEAFVNQNGFHEPQSIYVDSYGNTFVADRLNNRVTVTHWSR